MLLHHILALTFFEGVMDEHYLEALPRAPRQQLSSVVSFC